MSPRAPSLAAVRPRGRLERSTERALRGISRIVVQVRPQEPKPTQGVRRLGFELVARRPDRWTTSVITDQKRHAAPELESVPRRHWGHRRPTRGPSADEGDGGALQWRFGHFRTLPDFGAVMLQCALQLHTVPTAKRQNRHLPSSPSSADRYYSSDERPRTPGQVSHGKHGTTIGEVLGRVGARVHARV